MPRSAGRRADLSTEPVFLDHSRVDTPPDRGYTAGTMTWVDGCVLAVIAVSALLAFMRGMVQEVLGVGAWIGAAFLALGLRPLVTPYLAGKVEPAWLAEALAAAGIFLVVLVVLKLIIGSVGGLVQNSILGGPDRALGLAFGVVRGAFLVVVAYILGGLALPATERWPDAVREARALPYVIQGSNWLVEMLPAEYRPRVAAPPASPGPSQEDLMRPPARNRM
jgi:membrane protein required for colicin V production